MDYQKRFIIISFLLLIHLLGLTLANDQLKYFCEDKDHHYGTYTENSKYEANLNALLSSVSTNVSESGYYSGFVGENSDRVNAYAMCRGDIQLDTCRACISNSTRDLVKICPNRKEAVIWYDDCMLRYSNNSIAGILNTDLVFFMWNQQNVTNVAQFNKELNTLLDNQRSEVASGTIRKFATGNRTVPDAETIYLLQQCTPDLMPDDCTMCLTRGAAVIPQFFNGSIGGRVVGPSCNLRYEISSFFSATPSATAQPPSGEGSEMANSPAVQPPLGPSPSNKGGNGRTTTKYVNIYPFLIIILYTLF